MSIVSIYNFRLWLSAKLFRLGRDVHPDIARLRREILFAHQDLASITMEFDKSTIQTNLRGEK